MSELKPSLVNDWLKCLLIDSKTDLPLSPGPGLNPEGTCQLLMIVSSYCKIKESQMKTMWRGQIKWQLNHTIDIRYIFPNQIMPRLFPVHRFSSMHTRPSMHASISDDSTTTYRDVDVSQIPGIVRTSVLVPLPAMLLHPYRPGASCHDNDRAGVYEW